MNRFLNYAPFSFVLIAFIICSCSKGPTNTENNTWVLVLKDSIDNECEWFDATYASNKFVAVGHQGHYGGQGVAAYSTDGKLWTESGIYTIPNGISYGNNTFVAVGERPDGICIANSNDGTVWTTDGVKYSFDGITYTNSLSSTNSLVTLNDVVWGNNKFVAVGEGKFLSSSDGINWTISQNDSASFQNLAGVFWANNLFVVVGGNGTIFTSVDGVDWMKRVSSTDVNLYDVAFGNNEYLAVGDNRILTSNDGITWGNSIQAQIPFFGGLSFINNLFIVIGLDANSASYILTSHDGINWNKNVPSGLPQLKMHKVIWGNNRYVAVGDRGIYTSTSPITTE